MHEGPLGLFPRHPHQAVGITCSVTFIATTERDCFTSAEIHSRNSENSKANRIETMKGPVESGQICSVGRRKIAKKIAKNKRCYANTLRPRSRMLLKAIRGVQNLERVALRVTGMFPVSAAFFGRQPAGCVLRYP